MVLADSHRISHVPRYSGYGPSHFNQHTGLSPPMVLLSRSFCWPPIDLRPSYNPSHAETRLVWAIPTSLATTTGITIVFYSSGYLDVSVLRVCSFRWHVFNVPGCPIRKSTPLRLFASQRSLSQLITSFTHG